MNYKALFLDFYGTLVHEDDLVVADITKMISDHSPGNPSGREIGAFWWSTFRSLFESSYGDTFKTQRELEQESIQITLEHFQCSLDSRIGKKMFDFWMKPDIFEDTHEFLSKIELPICIVSNIDRSDITSAMRFHDIKTNMILTSEDSRAYKPRKVIFQLALSKMNLLPTDVLHIGDSLASDVVGAKACNIHSFWLNRKGKTAPEHIRPDYTGTSLLDVLKIMQHNIGGYRGL